MRHEDCGDIDERERCAKVVKGKRHTIFFEKCSRGVVLSCSLTVVPNHQNYSRSQARRWDGEARPEIPKSA